MKTELNRETWLMNATEKLSDIINEAGHKVPEVRVSVGFPSKGGGSKLKTIGECHHEQATSDGRAQIFIHPILEDSARVLGVLLHELCHATLGHGFGHGKEFKAIATACGLTGKMTATEETPELVERLNVFIGELGQYPHARLETTGKKQSTRLVKCECLECGYIVRTTRKWVDIQGAPICPCNLQQMKASIEEPEEEGDE